jgi:putative sterol carrier protein
MPRAGARPAARSAAATTEFFRGLDSHGHEPLLAKAKGTLRFDLDEPKRTKPWFVAIDRGKVSVARKDAPADCVVRADSAVFEQLVTGEANATAALLRGRVRVEGELELILLLQRLFPSPPGSRAGSSRSRR